MKNEVAKFCLRTDGTHTSVEVCETGAELSGLIATELMGIPELGRLLRWHSLGLSHGKQLVVWKKTRVRKVLKRC